ncbi:class I SAM-dependent methyltransferase, partial [Mycobacterium sp. E3198]|uniref:class I SAM-dependent methyltransferase n=1 Tax=Mycobacterium sp. E3198 TaxID=1834143 RepID=UPI001E2E6C9A
MSRTFEDLVAEADSVSVDGWDFSWLDGRATEERPSWGFQRQLSGRLAKVSAALDIHTGGGEVLAGAGPFPPTMAAIETWPPNAALATKRLHPLGVVLVATRDEPPLPFADEAFDLVTTRHPISVWWTEIRRVLRPGGTYFAQEVDDGPDVEELGPQPLRAQIHHLQARGVHLRAHGVRVKFGPFLGLRSDEVLDQLAHRGRPDVLRKVGAARPQHPTDLGPPHGDRMAGG